MGFYISFPGQSRIPDFPGFPDGPGLSRIFPVPVNFPDIRDHPGSRENPGSGTAREISNLLLSIIIDNIPYIYRNLHLFNLF